MAIYSFKCPVCHAEKDVMRRMDEALDVYFCDCGFQMDRQVEAPAWFRPGTYGKGGGR